MALDPTFRSALDAEIPALVEMYQHFHRHPELSMQEHRTADAIEEHLRSYGLEPFRCGGTGVVAVIENGEGPVVAFRADTDGLPIAEQTGLPYSSEATGTLPDGTETPVMHGCGHDTHITSGLGAAKLLTEHRDRWSGTAIMIFQPGEETSAGAAAMLEDGIWDRVPRPDAIYGQHVWPGVAGTVNITSGTAMAMADSLEVIVHGQQAHGSQPENAVDPIVLGAFMITRLQTIVSREISGRDSAVLTIGVFNGGLKENIIPSSARFTINIRTYDEAVRETVLTAVERIITAEAQASGAPAPEIRPMYGFPPVDNDPDLTASLIRALGDELGEDAVNVTPPVTGSEDFGRFGDAIDVPYVFWFFGGYSQAKVDDPEEVLSNHSPFFGPDEVETTLGTGVRAALTALLGHLGSR
ncbi:MULTISPECIES: amidohydrolase [Brevibacterium]|uniref:M20 family metallopeptidase n=1 Tax=Brevibacterium pityocampae TaxID=506594 RepID=A0ABP8J7U4_9MICO|nr:MULTISPECIES: amidohydrolase [Actinomycetes]MCK1802936.1 amidohydrolase [Brevibacterium sp. R8603A2]MCX0276773.1 amidohydrolase [Nocardia zapadnayensis]QCP04175.1 amidohydrolase [Brevibacterium sp. CS2]